MTSWIGSRNSDPFSTFEPADLSHLFTDEARRQADKLDNSTATNRFTARIFERGLHPRGRVIRTRRISAPSHRPCINRQDVLAKIVTAFELTDFVIEPDSTITASNASRNCFEPINAQKATRLALFRFGCALLLPDRRKRPSPRPPF